MNYRKILQMVTLIFALVAIGCFYGYSQGAREIENWKEQGILVEGQVLEKKNVNPLKPDFMIKYAYFFRKTQYIRQSMLEEELYYRFRAGQKISIWLDGKNPESNKIIDLVSTNERKILYLVFAFISGLLSLTTAFLWFGERKKTGFTKN